MYEAQRQTKHIGVGKTSKPISEIWEASPVLKEKGCQEVIEMAAKFQNPSSKQQQTKVVVVQQNRWDNASTTMPTSNRSQTSDSYIKDRQNRRNQVLE